MRRLFWVALGASVGVLVVRTVRQRAARLTPAGASEAVGGAVANISDAIRRLAEEIRAAAAEREAELVAALDLPDPSAPGAAVAHTPGHRTPATPVPTPAARPAARA